MNLHRAMKALLQPDAVAILGCSGNLDRINGRPLKYFLEKGYTGRLYPVNPHHEQIAGLRCFPDVAAIPGSIDLAVVALPAALAMDGVRQLVARKVPAAVIFSSGFAEMGAEGRRAQAEMARIARAGGLRFCGPNCVGIINAFERVTASFSEYLEGPAPAGPIAFVSQSGAFGTAIAVLARQRRLGLGYFINTGNEADIDVADAMEFVVEDPRVRVIAGYIEGIRNGCKLLAVFERALALGKPVILTKVGRSDAGRRAAASHTGALAGTDAVLEGVLRQKGVIRAEDEEQMIDLVEAFTHCRLPKGSGVGIASQSGGAGVLACDRAEASGLHVPSLSAATQEKLRAVLPAYSAVGNPVDVTGISLAEPELIRHAMKLVLADAAVDIGILWVRLMDAHVDTMIDIVTDIEASTGKTFVAAWLAPPAAAVEALRERGICIIRGAAQAVSAVAGLVKYACARERWLADAAAREQLRAAARSAVAALPAEAGVVATTGAAALLAGAGVRMVETMLARDVEAAVLAAQQLRYPVALKIDSRDIAHKSEAAGIRLGIGSEAALREAFADIVSAARRYNPSARIEGVLVQRMVGRGVEIVIGVHRDAAFGPVVMAGFGGILVELLNDVTFAAVPVTAAEADAMIERLRGVRLLEGLRGSGRIDRAQLCETLVNVSKLAAAAPRLAELDLNPVIAGPDGAVAVDWLMVLDEKQEDE